VFALQPPIVAYRQRVDGEGSYPLGNGLLVARAKRTRGAGWPPRKSRSASRCGSVGRHDPPTSPARTAARSTWSPRRRARPRCRGRARRTLCELVHERDVHVTVDILDTLRGRRRRRGLGDTNRVVDPVEQRCNGPRRRRLRGCHELRPPPTHLARRARRKPNRRQSDGELPTRFEPGRRRQRRRELLLRRPRWNRRFEDDDRFGVSRPPIVSAARTAANPSPRRCPSEPGRRRVVRASTWAFRGRSSLKPRRTPRRRRRCSPDPW